MQQVRLHFKSLEAKTCFRTSRLKQATAQAGEKKGTKLELLKVLSAHTQVTLPRSSPAVWQYGSRVAAPANARLLAELAAPPRRWWRAQTTSCCCPWRMPATKRRTSRSLCMVRKGPCCLQRLRRPVGVLLT